MTYIPDSLMFPLQDTFGKVPYGVSQSKVSDSLTEPAHVLSYDPLTHTAMVMILKAGYTERGIKVRGATHYQGADPGTGSQAAHYPGQPVDVAFLSGSATGMTNQGQIVSSKFHHQDHHAVAYPPFAKTGTGVATVHPNGRGGWGNATHTDDQSNHSETTTGVRNIEHWKNTHVVGNGSNKLRSQELTEVAAASLKDTANFLMSKVA